MSTGTVILKLLNPGSPPAINHARYGKSFAIEPYETVSKVPVPYATNLPRNTDTVGHRFTNDPVHE
jgi:hypothetical protein